MVPMFQNKIHTSSSQPLKKKTNKNKENNNDDIGYISAPKSANKIMQFFLRFGIIIYYPHQQLHAASGSLVRNIKFLFLFKFYFPIYITILHVIL